jgi:Uma2 family endonuclease
MAAVPATPLVSVDEYLNTSYRPEMEYVDGVLVQLGMPSVEHGLLRKILANTLSAYEFQLGYETVLASRTRIAERSRYRVPDVMLCPIPLPEGHVLTTVPWAVIEILSPDDKLWQQVDRFKEFLNLGVPHMLLLDPEHLVAYRYEDGGLTRAKFTQLDLPSGSLPFDTEALFQELTKRRNRGR